MFLTMMFRILQRHGRAESETTEKRAGPWGGTAKGEMDMRKEVWFGRMAGLALFGAGILAFPAFGETVYVNASALNYRNRPSLEADAVLGTVGRGTKMERISNEGEWSQVRLEDSKVTVYVASRYLTDRAPASLTGGGQNAQAGGSAGETGSSQTPKESPYADQTWEVALDPAAPYASFSKINSGKAIYYQNGTDRKNGKTICVNAGHGTKGGSSVKTLCHPDGSAKVTGGTTGAGATTAAAVSGGMTFSDGTAESKVTLEMAKILRDKLLEAGYDVLMIREGDDVQLDNVARTVLANENADIHIALHWDSTTSDKGCFFMSVPSNQTYRAMEPVASHWDSHNALGTSLIAGLKEKGNKIFSSGAMEMDLTQTSYSTIPSVDIELGDKASDHSSETLNRLGDGLLAGINAYFQ